MGVSLNCSIPTEMFGVPGISSGSQNGSSWYCQVAGSSRLQGAARKVDQSSAVPRTPSGPSGSFPKYGLAIGPFLVSPAGGQNHGPYIQRPKALMPPGSPGFWAGMYTWWYQKLPYPPQRLTSQVGSCAANCAVSGTNVRSWMTSGIPSPMLAYGPFGPNSDCS